MSRPQYEVAGIIKQFGANFVQKHSPNSYQLRVLQSLSICRTSALGGHKYRCTGCHKEHISYNSCRNRHCPKCQSAKQGFWVDSRIANAYPCKHYHMVFTIPEALNPICLLNSRWFYNQLFAAVWETLRQFGYTQHGVESGAICVLHTWGQNLSLHPHIHCIVPAMGCSLQGRMKPVGKNGKYLYPVRQLSMVFRSKLLLAIKKQLAKGQLLLPHQSSIEEAWHKPWVVFCEPSLGKPRHVIAYLGQYIHRVAISNHRIVGISGKEVTFKVKGNYGDGNIKTITLKGEEFLRRFCLHILPKGFVKIRHYGIYSTRFRSTILKDKMVIKTVETVLERMGRIMGINVHQCPNCTKGRLIGVEVIPRARAPGFAHHVVRLIPRQ